MSSDLARRLTALEAAHAELRARYDRLQNMENARAAIERRKQKKARKAREERARLSGKDPLLNSIDPTPALYGLPDEPCKFESKNAFSILASFPDAPPSNVPEMTAVAAHNQFRPEGTSDNLKLALSSGQPGGPPLPPVTKPRPAQGGARQPATRGQLQRRSLRQCVRDVLHKLRNERRQQQQLVAAVPSESSSESDVPSEFPRAAPRTSLPDNRHARRRVLNRRMDEQRALASERRAFLRARRSERQHQYDYDY